MAKYFWGKSAMAVKNIPSQIANEVITQKLSALFWELPINHQCNFLSTTSLDT